MTGENSFSRRLRRLARSWLASAVKHPEILNRRVFLPGGERIMLLKSAHLPDGYCADAILIVRGNFSCGVRCVFSRPVYVGGDCEIGRESRLQAITVDGSLTLCSAVQVRDWVDSTGRMEIRAGCKIASAAVSGTAIRLSLHAEAADVSAPEILTQSVEDGEVETLEPPRRRVGELRAPGNRGIRPAAPPWGVSPGKLQPLGAETWVYDGDLHLSSPVVLRAHLVTTGSFSCPSGSLLEGDVKAGGALSIGPRSVSKGNLIAQGDLVLGASSVFQGTLRGRQTIRLSTGVRGLRAGGPVAVHADGSLFVEGNVVVRGSLSSGHRVVAAPSMRRKPLMRVVGGLGA